MGCETLPLPAVMAVDQVDLSSLAESAATVGHGLSSSAALGLSDRACSEQMIGPSRALNDGRSALTWRMLLEVQSTLLASLRTDGLGPPVE
jgi:hypothetical protein